MSTIRLAFVNKPQVMLAALANPQTRPAFLISYYYWHMFAPLRPQCHIRDYVLDSGAFSAHNIGAEIKLTDYIDFCKRLNDSDDPPSEIFALDVIGDATASLRNTEAMWRAGVEAIPTHHRGSALADLKYVAANYPKIALGGVAMLKGGKKLEFAQNCFNAVWPKKIHGLGFGSEETILALPFHSVDATSWMMGPLCFGRWNSYGKMSVRGLPPVQREVDWYLALEKKARYRWSKEMATLDKAGKLKSDIIRDEYFAAR